jgi:hypothetical protein
MRENNAITPSTPFTPGYSLLTLRRRSDERESNAIYTVYTVYTGVQEVAPPVPSFTPTYTRGN